MYIYLDEKTNKIKEVPLSAKDSAGASIHIPKSVNRAQMIHDFMFGF
jgi:hypothetical protein